MGMKTLSTNDAKSRFGELAELVQREPVQVLKRQRTAFVAVSLDDFERMSRIEQKVRREALDALKAVQDEMASHNLTDEQKRELLAEYNLAADE